MRELGRNNAAVMGDATWFSEVHQSCFFFLWLCFIAETTVDTGWTEISVVAMYMLLHTIGAKAALFFLCCIAWILMGMTLHFFLDQSKPRTDYYLAIAATCVICTIVSCWIAWLI
jgi:hypothetical protein